MTLVEWLAVLLVCTGIAFLLAGTLALIRFPDVYTRLHALPKADNVGLGLVCTGLALYAGSVSLALKLLLIWLLMLAASAVGAGLIARAALARGIEPWRSR